MAKTKFVGTVEKKQNTAKNFQRNLMAKTLALCRAPGERERERERERALLGTVHNGGSRASPAHGLRRLKAFRAFRMPT